MTVYGIGARGSSSLSSNSVKSTQEESAKPGNRYGVTRKSSEEDEVIIGSVDDTDDFASLRRAFSKQITKLSHQHHLETDELLAKLDDMTKQFQTLTEQSANTIEGLEKKVASLGSRMGRMLSGLDRSAGAKLALRDISRFRQIASLGGEALNKLMTALGSQESKALQDLQARVAASDRQTSGGNTTNFSLMA